MSMFEKIPRKIAIRLFAVLLLLGGGCNYFYETTDPADLKIRSEDLFGEWAFNAQTLRQFSQLQLGLDKVPADENVIELRKDGTCTFKSYESFPARGDYLVSEGAWTLEREYEYSIGAETWIVNLRLTPKPNHIVGVNFLVKKRADSLILYDYLGDPDGHEYVEFEKRKVGVDREEGLH
jgi:hypothetical protein